MVTPVRIKGVTQLIISEDFAVNSVIGGSISFWISLNVEKDMEGHHWCVDVFHSMRASIFCEAFDQNTYFGIDPEAKIQSKT